MGSRSLPVDCVHGVCVDQGDFGSEPPDDDAPWETWAAWRGMQYPACPECRAIEDATFKTHTVVDLTALCADPEVMADIYAQQLAEVARQAMLAKAAEINGRAT